MASQQAEPARPRPRPWPREQSGDCQPCRPASHRHRSACRPSCWCTAPSVVGFAQPHLLVATMSPLVPILRGHRVLVRAGHSLGGALATLAAHDLQAEFGFPHLHCYTFGAPRTGNHAFAAETSRLVPETWHVINDRALLLRLCCSGTGATHDLRYGYCVPQRIQSPDSGSSGLHTRGDTSPATCKRTLVEHHFRLHSP